MKHTHYIRPMAVSVKLHDLMQVTVISGQADEDSMSRRLDADIESNSPDTWDTTMEPDA